RCLSDWSSDVCSSDLVTATTRLAEARTSNGPIGYTRWHNDWTSHGVIVAGYSHGLRPGPVLINGRRQRIIEMGMQSAYVILDDRSEERRVGKEWRETL